MKKLLIVSAIICQTAAMAQNSKITSSFKKLYPTATDSEWNEIENKNWQVEFVIGDEYYDSRFDINGTWIETTSNVDVEKLNSQVTASIKKYGSMDDLSEVVLVKKTGIEYYKATIDGEKESITLEISKDGKVTNEARVANSEDEESDDEEYDFDEE